jgi:hypothetical protein
MSAKPMTKKEINSSVTKMWESAIESTYKDLIEKAVLAERAAFLADVKKVFSTFDVLPESAEKKMLKSLTSIFIESILEQIESRVKS